MNPTKGTSYLRLAVTAGAIVPVHLPAGAAAFRVVAGGMVDGFFLIDEETSTGDIGIPASDGDWILTHGRDVAFDGRNLSAASSGNGSLLLAIYSGETAALTPGAPVHDHGTVRFVRSEAGIAISGAGTVTLFSQNDNELLTRYRAFDVRRTAGLYLTGVVHATAAFNLYLEAIYNGLEVIVASAAGTINLGSSGGFQYQLDRGFQVSAVTVDRRVNLPAVPCRLRCDAVAGTVVGYRVGLLSR
jgi:hypothetical protein